MGSWLSGKGPDADIVVSSRIRLARNITGIPFLSKISLAEQSQLLERIDQALKRAHLVQHRGIVRVEEFEPLEAQFLLERHLVSPDFVKSESNRGFFSTGDETFSLMVNEEDHLRMQTLGTGLCLTRIWDRMREVDDRLNAVLEFAYSDRYGFLTACPTNVGTGMRASVLIHLPGIVLTKEIDRVLRGVLQLGLSVRGTYGEGTKTKGHLFQISNQRTLGQSEEEIVSTLSSMAGQIITYERDARSYLATKMDSYVEDKVFRSLGILKYAKRLTSDEALNLLSTLRLGINILKNVDVETLNKLMILTKPANLQMFFSQDFPPEMRDLKRAELIKKALENVES